MNQPTIDRTAPITISGFEFPSIEDAEVACPRMDPERKPLILAVLRMPGLAQTRQVLHRLIPETDSEGDVTPVGMCCLGVMCEVAYGADPLGLGLTRIETGWTVAWEWNDRDNQGQHRENQVLPRPVADWLGFRHANPSAIPAGMAAIERRYLNGEDVDAYLSPTHSPIGLAELNDWGFTFPQIADIIDYFL